MVDSKEMKREGGERRAANRTAENRAEEKLWVAEEKLGLP